MAIAGYGLQWAKAPTIFPIVLILIGWLLITVAIYEHNFLEDKSKYIQVIGHVLISGCVAILFIAAWFALRPESQISQQEQVASTPERYAIASWHYFSRIAVWMYPYAVGAFVAWVLIRIFVQPRAAKTLSREMNATYQQLDKLKSQLEAYDWLHTMAAVQMIEIARHVALEEPFIYEHKLLASVPSIGFKLPMRNKSLFDISIEMTDRSRVYFDDVDLAGPTIVRHSGENISPMQLDDLTIEQRLTAEEAKHITSTPEGKFYFDKLIVMVKGGTRFPKVIPHRLMIDRSRFVPIQPKATLEEIERKHRAEIQIEKSRCARIHALSAVYGAGIQLYEQLTSEIYRDKGYPSDSKHSLEVWQAGLESAIVVRLSADALVRFREGSRETLAIPDSLEAQGKWVKWQDEKLGKLIEDLLQDK